MDQQEELGDLLVKRKMKDGFVNNKPPDKTVIDSQNFFFNEVGADESVFEMYPILAGFKVEGNLRPKNDFYRDFIGIKKETLAKNPRPYTYSLEVVKNRFAHYVGKFGGNEEQVKSMFKNATSTIGNDTTTIDDKIDIYDQAEIDFHYNYTLLEKDPLIVVDTKDYLGSELHILPPSENKDLWYYMLLGVSKETIKPKVKYCNRKYIKWEKAPKVLILGLGTEKRLGALPRRVNLIKKAFQNKQLPPKLDYLENPKVLISPDKILKNRIRIYK